MACGDTLLKRASLLPEDYLVGYLGFSRGYIGVGMANETEDGHFQIRGLYRSGPFKQGFCPSLTQFYMQFGSLDGAARRPTRVAEDAAADMGWQANHVDSSHEARL